MFKLMKNWELKKNLHGWKKLEAILTYGWVNITNNLITESSGLKIFFSEKNNCIFFDGSKLSNQCKS